MVVWFVQCVVCAVVCGFVQHFNEPTALACALVPGRTEWLLRDITFMVGEEKERIYAHKVILAARCEVFRAMFAEQKSQGKKGTERKPAAAEAPLVLQDVRPSGEVACWGLSCGLQFLLQVLAPSLLHQVLALSSCCTPPYSASVCCCVCSLTSLPIPIVLCCTASGSQCS